MITRNTVRHLPIILLTCLVTACGGGGGAGSGMAAPIDTSQGPGTVSVFLTDADTDRFNEILVTLEAIQLIPDDDSDTGDENPVTLFQGPITVNLRDLTDFNEFLAETEVPAGVYEKIRLLVSRVELREVDASGTLLDSIVVPVRSGKIDLNPRRGIVIADGTDLVVQLDFDADNSFRLTLTGNGTFQFRPVIFVKVLGDDGIRSGDDDDDDDRDGLGRLVRQHGSITAPDPDANTFDLCSLVLLSSSDNSGPGSARRLGNACLDVSYGDTTVIYDDALAVVADGDLVENSEATVFGHLRRRSNQSSFDALIVVIGSADTVVDRRADVLTAPDANGAFTVRLKPRHGVPDSEIAVQLEDSVIIVSREDGATLDTSAIQPSRRVLLLGQFDDTGTLHAIAVSVAGDADEVEGDIVSITPPPLPVTVTVSHDSTEACITVDTDTDIMSVDNDHNVVALTVDDLAPGMDIEAHGTPDPNSDCLLARKLVVRL